MRRSYGNRNSLQLSSLAQIALIAASLLLVVGGFFLLVNGWVAFAVIAFILSLLGINICAPRLSSAGYVRGFIFRDRPSQDHTIHPDDKPLNPWDNLSAPQEQKAKTRRSASKGPKAPWEE